MKDNKYVTLKSLSDNCIVNFGRPNQFSRLEYSYDTVTWHSLPLDGLPLPKKEVLHLKGYNLEFKTITPKEFFKFSGKISFQTDWQGFQYETEDYIESKKPVMESAPSFMGYVNDLIDSLSNWLIGFVYKPQRLAA